MNWRLAVALAGALAFGLNGLALAQDKSIVVSSTTSTTDSGLFGHILPLFKAKTGIDVKVVSQGTGQALDTGRRGDADVVFVHDKAAEEEFVAEGFGVEVVELLLEHLPAAPATEILSHEKKGLDFRLQNTSFSPGVKVTDVTFP